MALSKLLYGLLGLAIIATIGYFVFKPSNAEQVKDLTAVVKKGQFEITVTATGELQAKKSVKIRAPQGMRTANIWETTITDLVPEGKLVTAGQYVATLDRTELATKMRDAQTEIDKAQTQLDQAKIDTAIDLRDIRDQLVNLNFTRKEKLLKVEQSKYEPQSVIQQTQLDLERTERDFSQLEVKYELKQQQAHAKILEITTLLKQHQDKMQKYVDLSNEFTINAPESGMVIYARTWNGKKEPGSRISTWDPIVAELPDLTDMITKTFVNEVDISKVKVGQEVTIKVDAFPEKEYAGNVLSVANIGEQLRGYDTKVFEVIVQLIGTDTILRPAMTTSNEIVTNVIPDVISVPLEALQLDSLAFVYKRAGGKIVRQEVIAGLSNANSVIIDYGLEENEEVFLNAPKGSDEAQWVFLPAEVKEEIARKQEEERKAREAHAMELKKKMQGVSQPSPDGGGGDFFIIVD